MPEAEAGLGSVCPDYSVPVHSPRMAEEVKTFHSDGCPFPCKAKQPRRLCPVKRWFQGRRLPEPLGQPEYRSLELEVPSGPPQGSGTLYWGNSPSGSPLATDPWLSLGLMAGRPACTAKETTSPGSLLALEYLSPSPGQGLRCGRRRGGSQSSAACLGAASPEEPG